jgi:hypothetical protein
MVNVDAAFDEEEGCGSVGAVIRDSMRGVLVAAHSFVPHLIDAPMAKAYALKEGLMLAQHIGCNRLIIQLDCMEIVDIMKDFQDIMNERYELGFQGCSRERAGV